MNRFRFAREYLGFKPKEACRFFKITLLDLELIETGQRSPPGDLVALASKLYGRPPVWLLGGPEDPLEVPRALLDFARTRHRRPIPQDLEPGPLAQEPSADALELARFAQYLAHRAQTRGIA